MPTQEIETFCPTSRQHWRQWLQMHHETQQSIWLIYYKKGSSKPTISWSEAVDEALCFGWVDSQKKPIDEEKYRQLFSRRRANGTWSKINKDKILQLLDKGLMTKVGLECMEKAKHNGSWTILDAVETLKTPKDLEKEFKKHPGSKAFFNSLSKSARKSILQWLVLAKRPETRQKRMNEIAALAAQKRKPKHLL